MTKLEFIERTGYQVLDEEYKAIEEMYCNAGNMDKDEFCKNWVEIHDNDLFRLYYNQFKNFSNQYDVHMKMLKEAAYNMVISSVDNDDDSLYWGACKLIGQKAVVIFKIENDYELNKADKEYIKENLA